MLSLPQSTRVAIARHLQKSAKRRASLAEWICPEILDDEFVPANIEAQSIAAVFALIIGLPVLILIICLSYAAWRV